MRQRVSVNVALVGFFAALVAGFVMGPFALKVTLAAICIACLVLMKVMSRLFRWMDQQQREVRCAKCGEEITYLVLLCNDDVHQLPEVVDALVACGAFADPKEAEMCASLANSSGRGPVREAGYHEAIRLCKNLQSAGFHIMLLLPNAQYEDFPAEPRAIASTTD